MEQKFDVVLYEIRIKNIERLSAKHKINIENHTDDLKNVLENRITGVAVLGRKW